MSLLLWSCSSFALRAPSLCTNLFWTLRCCLEHLHPSLLLLGHGFCSSPYLCRPHQARPAPRPVAAREDPHREALCKVSCSSEPCPSASRARDSFVLSQRGSDVFLTSPSVHCDCFRHTLLSRRPHRESVLRISLAHLAVGVSRARHRLSVTFEMLGLCWCSDAMSSSSWILSFAPSTQ